MIQIIKATVLTITLLQISTAAISEPCNIYISPYGDDSNPGTEQYPVLNLSRVHQILQELQPQSDVIIKIRSDCGPYINQCLLWTYYNPKYSITFESLPSGENARFIADDDPPGEPFFVLEADDGKPTNIVFKRLTIIDYVDRAILLKGDRENRNNWNGHNVIEDCVFNNIGNSRMPEKQYSHSVIGIVNSRNNVIKNCRFSKISNNTIATFPQRRPKFRSRSKFQRLLHDILKRLFFPNILNYEERFALSSSGDPNIPIICIYIAHHSDSNCVMDCEFNGVMGDAVRIRDDSNNNSIIKNYFELAGWNALISTWYCKPERDHCTKVEVERPSFGIIVRDNRARGNWLYGEPRIFFDFRVEDDSGHPGGEYPFGLCLENNVSKPYYSFLDF